MVRQEFSNGVIYREANGEFISGRGAGFPADVPPDGALFWRQDFRAFYAWNRTGTGWELVDTGGAGGGVAISADAESQSSGTVVFSNSNGVSFGLAAGVMTASAGGAAPGSISAGTASVALGQAVFSNSNGVSFGLDGSTVTATVKTDYLTTAQPPGAYLTTAALSQDSSKYAGTNGAITGGSITVNTSGVSVNLPAYLTTAMASNRGSDFVQAAAAFAGTSASGTIASGGISVSIGPYITTGALSNHSHGNPTLALTNLAGTTASNSGGFTLSLSHNISTAALSNHSHGASGANGSFGFQTLSFSNANGVSFGTSAGSAITASHNALTTAALSDHSHGVTLNLTNLSGTTGGGSAGITLSLSAAAPGAAAITQTVGLSNVTAGGATGGTTGGVTGDDVQYIFVPGSNITMSQSVNGSSGTLSIYGPAPGGGATLSGWNPDGHGRALWVTSGIGNASLFLRAVDVDIAFQYDRMAFPMHFSQATNSTLSVSNTVAWGWYSRNASTLSLYKSGSGTFSINGSGTASSANNSGIRVVSLASTDTITAGNYYLGFVWRTSSAGNNASLSYIAVSQWASTISGFIGLATNTRMAYHPAGGVWTSTTINCPNSLAFSDIRGNSSAFQRQPVMHFTSGGISF